MKDTGKLDSQAVEGHLVGYDEESKGYRLYFPKCRSVVVERDVYFNKDAVVAAMAAGLSLQTCLLTNYVYISSMQKGSSVKRQV